MSDNLLAGPIALICTRVTDPSWQPIEGSTVENCCRCGHHVYVSPASQRRVRPGDAILCIECSVEIAQQRGVPWVDGGRNADQLAEMAANGLEPRQFKERRPQGPEVG